MKEVPGNVDNFRPRLDLRKLASEPCLKELFELLCLREGEPVTYTEIDAIIATYGRGKSFRQVLISQLKSWLSQEGFGKNSVQNKKRQGYCLNLTSKTGDTIPISSVVDIDHIRTLAAIKKAETATRATQKKLKAGPLESMQALAQVEAQYQNLIAEFRRRIFKTIALKFALSEEDCETAVQSMEELTLNCLRLLDFILDAPRSALIEYEEITAVLGEGGRTSAQLHISRIRNTVGGLLPVEIKNIPNQGYWLEPKANP